MLRKPDWIKKKIFDHNSENHIKKIIKENNLSTVCSEAGCPNLCECFKSGTATFLLLGNVCTRNCVFCNISHNEGDLKLDIDEPARILKAVIKMNLKFVVLTCVTRDDLEDGGASIIIETVELIKQYDKGIDVEVLVSDFNGNYSSIDRVLNSNISVFNHNLETIEDLYNIIRPMASYSRSLNILKYAKKNGNVPVKTGIMVGLGEKAEQVNKLMKDFAEIGGDILTIGQYLQPGRNFYPVREYITPHQFDEYKKTGESYGIKTVFSGPFVRSSYHAEILHK